MAAEGEIITLSPDSLTFMGLRITDQWPER
jgi:hypothetical protein